MIKLRNKAKEYCVRHRLHLAKLSLVVGDALRIASELLANVAPQRTSINPLLARGLWLLAQIMVHKIHHAAESQILQLPAYWNQRGACHMFVPPRASVCTAVAPPCYEQLFPNTKYSTPRIKDCQQFSTPRNIITSR